MKNFYLILALIALLFTGCTNAGKDQTVTAGTKVTLDGSGAKTDLGGKITRYTWEQLPEDGVPSVHIFDRYNEYASFIAPYMSKETVMKFKLTTVESYNCKDNQDSSCNHHKSSSKVKITVEASTEDGNTTTSNGTDTSTGSKTVAITGSITTAANAGISGAVVTSNNKTSTSGSTGSYTLSQITTSGRTVVHASHPDYFDNSHVVIANTSNNFSQNIKLSQILASQTFDSGEGTTLTQGEASVEIPANIKYLSESKKSYKGEVTIKMAYYDATDTTGKNLLPGEYEGSNGSNYFPIYAHSFMYISLTNKDGNPLTVKNEDNIQLHFPSKNATNQLTTWTYSNTTGYWLKDGTSEELNGRYDIPANASGTYGLNTIAPFGTLNLCVEDSSNTAIEGANIVVKTNNWRYPLIQTDKNGKVSLNHVLASAPLTITASKVIDGVLYTKNYANTITLSEGELQNLTNCIELGKARVTYDNTTDNNTTDNNTTDNNTTDNNTTDNNTTDNNTTDNNTTDNNTTDNNTSS